MEERTPPRNVNPIPGRENSGCVVKWSGTRMVAPGKTKIMRPPAPVGGSPACRISWVQ